MNLVKSITSDNDLLKLSNILNVKIDHIYDLGEIKNDLPDQGSFLILLRTNSDIGHWVAMYNDVWFDSYGLPAPEVIQERTHYTKQIQAYDRDYCGPFCILWLYCMQHNKSDLFEFLFCDLNIDV